jgi:hypothetical protein
VYVTERDFQVKREYYRDQVRAAQRYQRSKSAGGPDSASPSIAQAMTWLGGRLAEWGESLQERYSTVVPPTVPQPR